MKFINPANVVAQMGLRPGNIVADLGSGSGFFVLAAAKFVGNTGIVYAVDVQEAKLTATLSASTQQGFKNVQAIKADLDKPFTDIEETSCDAVIMASILHEIGSRQALLKNAYRILKTGGKILAVEWKVEHTPFGPPLEKRISEEQLEHELGALGLRKEKGIPADMYHYAAVFVK
ncbi:MAG: methyltransferase domain-containing protein [bacterium]|nr:methyltransferase domain-containing protein [bacterium]